MELINQLKSLEDIIAKHSILIEKESRNLASEYSISSSQKAQDEINKIDNDNRLLKIGIVGRVKAGKSSLLNSLLFNGKSVLPKAATPMTAALTVISYGEELSAEVEFFTEKDIENIKSDAAQYEVEFKILLNQKIDEAGKRAKKKSEKLKNKKGVKEEEPKIKGEITLEQKFTKSIIRDLDKSEPSLSASYDQYQRIKQSGIDHKSLENSKIVLFETLESLGKDLGEYVGSNGKYMPFTKSVHIRIPQENLKNIQLVDTPGVNDPVVSREERTRDLLKFCDVVFIVSPAGQFMSNEDLELMDRITSKEGVRELFVIASKCDMQLYGSVKDNSGGDLHKAFDAITTDLSSSLHSTLSGLKKKNPEIGGAYDKLIMQSKESIIHSSGISLAIKESYDNQSILDEGELHAWGMLVNNYPDYFSNSDKNLTIPNLELLSNIGVISKAVSGVRDKKDEILAKRKEEYLKAKTDSLAIYKKELLQFIELSIKDINDGDVNELKATRKRINHIKLKVSGIVDEEYYDLVSSLKINMSSTLKGELRSHFKESKRDIDNAEGSDTESYEVEKSGAGNWVARKLWNGGSETRTRSFTTVRAGAVRASLSELTSDIELAIKNISGGTILSWKKNITPTLLTVLRDNVDDEDLAPEQIRKAVRNVIERVGLPSLSYQNDFNGSETENKSTSLWLFGKVLGSSRSSLRDATGTLTGSNAECFLDKARDYVGLLRQQVHSDIDLYLDELISELKKVKLSSEIFAEYDNQLEELEKKIENREITLEEYDRLNKELCEIE